MKKILGTLALVISFMFLTGFVNETSYGEIIVEHVGSGDRPTHRNLSNLMWTTTHVVRAEILDSRVERRHGLLMEDLPEDIERFMRNTTIYRIRILEAFYGDTRAGDIVEFSQVGGRLGNVDLINRYKLPFVNGAEYIFFLRCFEVRGLDRPMVLSSEWQGVYHINTPSQSIISNHLSNPASNETFTPFTMMREDLRPYANLNLTAQWLVEISGARNRPIIMTTHLPNGIFTESYTYTLQAKTLSDNDAPITWSVGSVSVLGSQATAANGLPPGLTLNPTTGIISGILQNTWANTIQNTTHTFTVYAENEYGFAYQELSITGTQYPITSKPPIGVINQSFRMDIQRTQNPSLSWAVIDGHLPTGLHICPDTGVISGRPSEVGIFEFTIQAISDVFNITSVIAIEILYWVSATVGTESELLYAIANAGTIPTAIYLTRDMTLTSTYNGGMIHVPNPDGPSHMFIISHLTAIRIPEDANIAFRSANDGVTRSIIVNGGSNANITVSAFSVRPGATLTLDGVNVQRGNSPNTGIYAIDATVFMEGGSITGFPTGVNINTNTTFIMSGGSIHGNRGNAGTGHGVRVRGNSTFILNNGIITNNNVGVTVTDSVFNMHDGSISGNGGGAVGGVNINNSVSNWYSSTFNMHGGTIFGNDGRDVGGISASATNVTIFDGIIANNIGDVVGGIRFTNGTLNAPSHFTIHNGTISNNIGNQAGGLFTSGGHNPSLFIGTIPERHFWATGVEIAIGQNVIFSGNRAGVARERNPQNSYSNQPHIRVHATEWTTPFTCGFNNFDIRYGGGQIVDWSAPVATVNPWTDHDFGVMLLGYTDTYYTPHTFSITNQTTSSRDIGVRMTGDTHAFVLSGSDLTNQVFRNVPAGALRQFSIAPAHGMSAGTYRINLGIDGQEGAIEIVFQVISNFEFSWTGQGSMTASAVVGGTSVSVGSGSNVPRGSEVVLTATPAEGWYLARWYVNGNLLNEGTQNHITLIREDGINVQAIFQPNHISYMEFVIDFAKEMLNGIKPGMQWSTNGTTWTNIVGDELNISSMIPNATAANSTILRIRFAATSTSPPSDWVEIPLTRRAATPTSALVRFDGFTETIQLNEAMELRQGTTGEWTYVELGATSASVTLATANATWQVRIRGNENQFPSMPLNVTVPARRAAPNAVYNAMSDAITGVSSAMEFSIDGGGVWTRLAATTITRSAIGQEAAVVYVRIAATAVAAASAIRVVQVPEGPGASPSDFEIDFIREVLMGVAPGMQWSTNGTTWTNINTYELDIVSMIPAATAANNTVLRIRVAPTATTPPSIATEIPLMPRAATPSANDVRFDGFTETILIDDTMEFRHVTSGEWISAEEGQTSVAVEPLPGAYGGSIGAVIGPGNSWQVRVRGTGTQFPSATMVISIPRRPNTSSVTYNAVPDAITGMSSAMKFSVDDGQTWTQVTGTSLPRSVLGNDAVAVHVKVAATATSPMSAIRIIQVPEGPTNAPTGMSIDFSREVLMGVARGMQWSTDGTRWTNITANELNIATMIPAATASNDTVLSIRFAPTDTAPPSRATEILLAPRVPTPNATIVRFDGFSESIILNDAMEFRQGTSGVWILVESGQISLPVTLGTSNVTWQVRARKTETQSPSTPLNVTVPRRIAAPNAAYNALTDTITGVSTAMEFSINGGQTWTMPTSNTITRATLGHGAVTVYIRVAATATAAVSTIRVLQVPAGSSGAPTGFTIDFSREVITGVAPGMQWSTNGTTWTNITTTELNIATMIPAANAANITTLRIRYSPTATSAPSDSFEIPLNRRQTTPTAATARFDGFTESILANDTMEFRRTTTGVWSFAQVGQANFPVTLGTANVTYQVRVGATSNQFASVAFNITVPRRPAAPNATYNTLTDTITGASTAMEFSIDNGQTWTRVTTTTITREMLGRNAVTVHIRTAATAASAISAVRVVQVPTGPSNLPTGFTIDFAREVVTGVAPGMQWSTNGTAWTNITTTELNIATMIPAANAANVTTLRIRFSPTSTSAPSYSYEMQLSRRQPTPTTAIVRFDGFTESILASDTMEFRRTTTGNWILATTGQANFPVTLGTANVTYQVRTRATINQFASATLNVTVPRRPAAPNANFNAASNAITGVSTAMEFSLNGGQTWTRATASNIPRAILGNSAVAVHVRVAATATNAASVVRIVQVPQATQFDMPLVPSEMPMMTDGVLSNPVNPELLTIPYDVSASPDNTPASPKIPAMPDEVPMSSDEKSVTPDEDLALSEKDSVITCEQ